MIAFLRFEITRTLRNARYLVRWRREASATA